MTVLLGRLPRAVGECASTESWICLQAGILEVPQVINSLRGSEESYHFPSRRYKMISQFTWPNFPTGNAEEGTKVLLEDRKLVKDVTFGKTKIFVRTPATLFELERAR